MFKEINYFDILNEILYPLREELIIDEQSILEARHALHREPIYNHEEVWKELGV